MIVAMCDPALAAAEGKKLKDAFATAQMVHVHVVRNLHTAYCVLCRVISPPGAPRQADRHRPEQGHSGTPTAANFRARRPLSRRRGPVGPRVAHKPVDTSPLNPGGFERCTMKSYVFPSVLFYEIDILWKNNFV